MSRKDATIADIAKRVNMTTITVSRALNKPDQVKPATLERILEVARELNYVPNAFARSLKRSESRIIGVVVASVGNPFYSDMIKAISREARRHGYTTMLVDTDETQAQETRAVETLLSYRVAGIILSPASDEPDYQPAYVEPLRSGNTPVVFLDRTLHDTPFSRVVLDNYHSGRKTAGYLLQQERLPRQVLLLTGPAQSRISMERLKGVREVLAEQDMELIIRVGDYTLEPAYRSTLQWLDDNPPPDAILGFNQLITLGAMRALRERGIAHRSLVLCGIDPLPFGDILGVPVACVAHDASLAGSSAVRLLLEHLEDPTKPRVKVVIPGELLHGSV